MKKNLTLFISILALILLILFLRVNINKDSEFNLSGELISDGIYAYDLKSAKLKLNGIFTDDEYVYYLLMDILDEEEKLYNYKLKKLNIYTNEIEEINTISKTYAYCSLKEEKIYCNTKNNFTVYDLNLNKIFNYTTNDENSNATYIPYKDIYIKLENLKISLIINNETELYRNIESNKTLYYNDHIDTINNTYIILSDEEENYYIYDINENNLISVNQQKYFKYELGIVFYDESFFEIYDLVNNNTIKYKNNIQKDYFYTGLLSKDNTTFYLYDIIDDKIFIEDISAKAITEIDTNLFASENPITNLTINNNYLYIYVLQDKNNFYIIDLDNLNLPKINIDDYSSKLLNNINNTISEIKEVYDVNVNIKDDAIIKFPDFSAEVLTNDKTILTSLNKIKTILSKYNKSFFESFYNNGFDGLNLYLTSTLTPSNYDTQVSNPAAYSLTYEGKYMIVIDLNQPNIEELLCHELLHNLEFNLNNQNIYPFEKWLSYNPDNFYYSNSYTNKSNFDYTLNETVSTNVYFIDYYSHTFATEDRARVFEKICSCDNDSIINDYPNLYEKGIYLKEEIIKYYPELINTNLFNSLN